MKNRFILLFFCLGFSLPGWLAAQNAALRGVVTDSTAGDKPDDIVLYGATATAFDKAKNTMSGIASVDLDPETGDMRYLLELPAGTYMVKFNYTGMKEKSVEVTLSAGETRELNVNLETAAMIDVVVVTGNKSGTSVAKSTVSIDVMGAQLVDNSAATRVDDAVNKVPGVTVVDGQANIRGGAGYSYGAGSRVLILIDDMPFMQADAGYPNWRDIPIENIDQIEVLKGAASALYGSSALNGIINIRTAYAKNDPVSKVALFGTAFGTPRRRNTAWWLQDEITVEDYLVQERDTSYSVDTTFQPKAFSGPMGYRTPKEFGLLFAHRRKIGKLDLTFGGNLFSQDAPLGGQYERKIRINTNIRYRISEKINFGAAINFNYGASGSFFLWGNRGTVLAPPGAPLEVDSLIYFSREGAVTPSKILRFAVDPFFTAFDKHENRHRVQARVFHVNNQNGNNQSNISTLNYLEYQNQSLIKKADNLQLVAGLVGQFTTVTAELYGNAKYQVANAAAYLQLEKGFFKKDNGENKLNISFGSRVEMNFIKSPDSILLSAKDTARSLNPEPLSVQAKPVFRVGVNYEATPVTFIRASWGQGYRYPTVAERYIATLINVLEIRPNPTLKSETGWSAELGIKQGFQITRKWKGFFDASFFWTEYQNMMEFTFRGGQLSPAPSLDIYFQSINTGNTRVLGTELTVMGTGTIADAVKMNVMAGYTFIDPRFKNFDSLQQTLSTDTVNILKYRSQHTAKLDVEFFVLKKLNYPLSFAVAFQYNSAMRAIDAAFENLFLSQMGNTFNYDAFGIGYYRANFNRSEAFNLSARVGYRVSLTKKDANGKPKEFLGMKVSLVGNNLLNQEYTIRPGLMAMPINFTARLDVDF